ncbi:uncharacterized protein J7T54_007624 [Emericellopsis cladophorae]|uniref:lytic cellulose monooxygenase (C4-dehydrogenating) n=1 Tax=Emericellopsis cladophorae TaxID=2686198 RepID=A0A9P9XW73_9HYPO|nr:uncharacterized protein J7T54_007624 [Emericellopsis cladophorae]KAI6778683.1 hypothetical protein J7T54_007624 [Emericellopsis cladophorae]
MPSTTRTLVSALAGAVGVAAHGYVENVVINGVSYRGYDVTNFPYNPNPPTVIGWSSEATDLGFVAPDAFQDPDIICHRGSENAGGYAEIAAGDSLFVQWNTWPESHKGPIIDYLANCGDEGCASVDKNTLEFFKIAEAGLIDGSSAPLTMADSLLEENGMGWMVTIPADLAPGNYVLRHEIIALHSGGDLNGAQNYPQCFSLKVTGSGSAQPEGVLGTQLYTAEDEGIHFNIYSPADSYPIPGPALFSGFSPVEQASSAIDSTGTATVGDGPAPTAAPAEPTGGNDDGAASSEAPVVTEAPATTEAPVVPSATATAAPTTEEAAQPEPTQDTCALKKRSKKARRHAHKHGKVARRV